LAAPGNFSADVPSAAFNKRPPLALLLLLLPLPKTATVTAPAVGSSAAHQVTRLAHNGLSTSPVSVLHHTVTLFKL
jgi:hypothetical protein